MTRVAMFAAFCLLAWTATASAECAWIAWQHIRPNNPAAPSAGDWMPSAGYRSKFECEPFAQQMNDGAKKLPRDSGGYKYAMEYVCLPDTVDPRVPKGK